MSEPSISCSWYRPSDLKSQNCECSSFSALYLGRSRKHTLPSSSFQIKIFSLVQKSLNHFWFGNQVNTVSFNLHIFQTSFISIFFSLPYFYWFFSFQGLKPLYDFCCYFYLCFSAIEEEIEIFLLLLIKMIFLSLIFQWGLLRLVVPLYPTNKLQASRRWQLAVPAMEVK